MTKKIDLSRREFLRNASLISAAGSVAAPFALNLFAMNVAAAAAQTAEPPKAEAQAAEPTKTETKAKTDGAKNPKGSK